MDYFKGGWSVFNLQDEKGVKNIVNFKSGGPVDEDSRFNLLNLQNLSLHIENSSNRPKFTLDLKPMEVNMSGPTFDNIIRLVDEIVETTKNKQTQIEKLI